MRIILIFLYITFFLNAGFAQDDLLHKIRQHQLEKLKTGKCLDFIRSGDIEGLDIGHLQQIIIIRHGEPAMNKKGWKNRKEAIRYTEMYDSVGVYDFHEKPVCLRAYDGTIVFTSNLPRAINTAQKTLDGKLSFDREPIFNEFERKIIQFPNIRLPRQFWSITTRVVWMLGFNDAGIESFRQAKERAGQAASLLDEKTDGNEKVLLFAHGFLNKYVKQSLKKSGYNTLNLDGQKYLGAYYFYKLETE